MKSTGNEVANIALHMMNWKKTPSPMSTRFRGTKFEPKHATATKAARYPYIGATMSPRLQSVDELEVIAPPNASKTTNG